MIKPGTITVLEKAKPSPGSHHSESIIPYSLHELEQCVGYATTHRTINKEDLCDGAHGL